jgi:nitrate reductase gamma subunit
MYYKLWQLFKRVKTNDMPATNAMIFLTIWQFINLFVVYILIEQYFVGELRLVFESKNDIYLTVGFFYSLLTLINYFFLYKNREKLFKKYRIETLNRNKLGNILLLIYIIGSFVLLFYFGPKYSTNVMK